MLNLLEYICTAKQKCNFAVFIIGYITKTLSFHLPAALVTQAGQAELPQLHWRRQQLCLCGYAHLYRCSAWLAFSDIMQLLINATEKPM